MIWRVKEYAPLSMEVPDFGTVQWNNDRMYYEISSKRSRESKNRQMAGEKENNNNNSPIQKTSSLN